MKKVDLREILQGFCMLMFLFSLLLVEVNIPLAFILIVLFGGLAFLLDKGIL